MRSNLLWSAVILFRSDNFSRSLLNTLACYRRRVCKSADDWGFLCNGLISMTALVARSKEGVVLGFVQFGSVSEVERQSFPYRGRNSQIRMFVMGTARGLLSHSSVRERRGIRKPLAVKVSRWSWLGFGDSSLCPSKHEMLDALWLCPIGVSSRSGKGARATPW